MLRDFSGDRGGVSGRLGGGNHGTPSCSEAHGDIVLVLLKFSWLRSRKVVSTDICKIDVVLWIDATSKLRDDRDATALPAQGEEAASVLLFNLHRNRV